MYGRRLNEDERYINYGFCFINDFKTEVPRGKIYTIEDQIEFGDSLTKHYGIAIYDKKLDLHYVFQTSSGIYSSSSEHKTT